MTATLVVRPNAASSARAPVFRSRSTATTSFAHAAISRAVTPPPVVTSQYAFSRVAAVHVSAVFQKPPCGVVAAAANCDVEERRERPVAQAVGVPDTLPQKPADVPLTCLQHLPPITPTPRLQECAQNVDGVAAVVPHGNRQRFKGGTLSPLLPSVQRRCECVHSCSVASLCGGPQRHPFVQPLVRHYSWPRAIASLFFFPCDMQVWEQVLLILAAIILASAGTAAFVWCTTPGSAARWCAWPRTSHVHFAPATRARSVPYVVPLQSDTGTTTSPVGIARLPVPPPPASYRRASLRSGSARPLSQAKSLQLSSSASSSLPCRSCRSRSKGTCPLSTEPMPSASSTTRRAPCNRVWCLANTHARALQATEGCSVIYRVWSSVTLVPPPHPPPHLLPL